MSILTSDPFLITWSMSFGIVSFLLRFISSGANLIICDLGICFGIWGIVSAFIVRWKQMNPHHNTRKCEFYANLVVMLSIPCFLLVNYLFISR